MIKIVPVKFSAKNVPVRGHSFAGLSLREYWGIY
jgi:hypothetical protein